MNLLNFEMQGENALCPICGEPMRTTVFRVISAEDAEAKQSILNGAFKSLLNEPDEDGNIYLEPLVYEDREKGYAIYMMRGDDIPNMEIILDSFESNGKDGIVRRIVTDPYTLREKIMIFDAGLDDRVVEIMKASALNSAVMHKGIEDVRSVFFRITDSTAYCDIFDDHGEGYSALVPEGLYEICEKFLAEHLFNESFHVVDSLFANDILWGGCDDCTTPCEDCKCSSRQMSKSFDN